MLCLGLDTSNYTSSAALADEQGRIIEDRRIMLSVKDGEKGLRQSDALFQHWDNMPQLLKPLLEKYKDSIECVCASAKPRPQEGSYMPVFKAGVAAGELVSGALGVPLHLSTHQEGHLAAAAFGNRIDYSKPLLFAHLSGGTLEIVALRNGLFSVEGGTKDISYGQLLDRAGVDMGYPFPAGKYIDEMACGYTPESRENPFKRVFTDDAEVNLSGLETQFRRAKEEYPHQALSYFLMDRISESFIRIMEKARAQCGTDQVLITGGVASSRFLRQRCKSLGYSFGDPGLCSDNAAGIALIRGRAPWQ